MGLPLGYVSIDFIQRILGNGGSKLVMVVFHLSNVLVVLRRSFKYNVCNKRSDRSRSLFDATNVELFSIVKFGIIINIVIIASNLSEYSVLRYLEYR